MGLFSGEHTYTTPHHRTRQCRGQQKRSKSIGWIMIGEEKRKRIMQDTRAQHTEDTHSNTHWRDRKPAEYPRTDRPAITFDHLHQHRPQHRHRRRNTATKTNEEAVNECDVVSVDSLLFFWVYFLLRWLVQSTCAGWLCTPFL